MIFYELIFIITGLPEPPIFEISGSGSREGVEAGARAGPKKRLGLQPKWGALATLHNQNKSFKHLENVGFKCALIVTPCDLKNYTTMTQMQL